MCYARFDHSMCAYKKKFLIVSGAAKYNNASKVELYDTSSRGEWQDLPPLKIGRYYHTSTSRSDQIYVFCGRTRPSGQPISSIEVLDFTCLAVGWRLIEDENLTPRFGSGVCESATEPGKILILGGASKPEDVVYLLDTGTKTVLRRKLCSSTGSRLVPNYHPCEARSNLVFTIDYKNSLSVV